MGVFASSKPLISDSVLSGVVVRSSSAKVQVAFDDIPEDVNFHSYSGRLQLVKMNNNVTYRRMKK